MGKMATAQNGYHLKVRIPLKIGAVRFQELSVLPSDTDATAPGSMPLGAISRVAIFRKRPYLKIISTR